MVDEVGSLNRFPSFLGLFGGPAAGPGMGPVAGMDPCTPCPCPSRKGWGADSYEITQAQEARKGIGTPLRFRVGAGPAEVAAEHRRRSCLGLLAVIVVVTVIGVALS